MADQVREAFEAWFRREHPGVEVRVRNPLGMYTVSSVNATWEGWEAATASHAAEVEALRSALADAVHLIETLVAHHGARLLPAGEERLEGYRAALKGDKP